MPVKFLKPEQITAYGQYRGEPSTTQLGMYFHLDDFDLEVMAPWRTDHTRLGFALQRLESVRGLGLQSLDLSAWPVRRIQGLARYGMTAWAQTLTQLEDDRRLATLLAVSKELEANIQDEVLDLFMMLTKAKFKTAQKEG